MEEHCIQIDIIPLPFMILSQLSLEQYIPLFQKEDIDLNYFLNFNQDQLMALGIQDPGDLWLLLNCSKQLKLHILEKNSNRQSICQSILEEEDNEDDNDLESTKSQDLSSSSSSSDMFSKIIHTFENYHHPPCYNLIAKPGTIIPRSITNNIPRPVSMPIQLPSNHQEELIKSITKRLDKSKSMIFPREEEGREELPAYSCTVYKMGYVSIKRELDAPNIQSRWRNWRKLYVELWGTLLKIYRAAPKNKKHMLECNNRWPFKLPYYYYKYYYTPIFTISLAGADASRAFDYLRRPNVLRLSTVNGPQLLMKLSTHVEMISWVEHLQAAINISLDLESRPMPKFVTIPNRILNSTTLDQRTIELERAREQRRRDQREILI